MNGQNSAENRKPKAWAWQDVVIAVVAAVCILFSTVMVARGVDTASIGSQRRDPGSRATLHHSVTVALSAAASEVSLDKLREEARYLANGMVYRCNVSSFPGMAAVVSNAHRPFAALLAPILRAGQ